MLLMPIWYAKRVAQGQLNYYGDTLGMESILSHGFNVQNSSSSPNILSTSNFVQTPKIITKSTEIEREFN